MEEGRHLLNTGCIPQDHGLVFFNIISATDRRAGPRILGPFMAKLLCLESRTWETIAYCKAGKQDQLPAVAQCDATINYLQTLSESFEADCLCSS